MAGTQSVLEGSARDAAGLREAMGTVTDRGAIARGLGRSYGDPAQNRGGAVVRLHDLVGDVVVDDVAATATVPAGISIDDLLRVLVPRGFFVPVTPGTRFVTIGGAIASDIHGKNHHVDGSFGNHVRRLSLLGADGSVAELSPQVRPDLFWATIGGMGLTGIVLDATIDVIPIETSRIAVDTHRTPDLDTLLSMMTEHDRDFRYAVAWIDLMARGKHMGRGVLTFGDHARRDELSATQSLEPLAYDPSQRVALPPLVPPQGLITPLTTRAFNEVWYRKAPRRRIGQIVSIPGYFHPLDLVGSWNRIYGRPGFVQYQFVVPFGAEDTVRDVVTQLSGAGVPTFLAVLKRFGAANPAPLSFPAPGWTLALDVPTATPDLAALLHGFDELVLAAGGRHYLAKDGHTTPGAIRRGYPRLAEWQAVRDGVDPTGVWASDQSRRLHLTG